jgi:uncharacterized membrane protein
MTEGSTPREPREEPLREPPGVPEAPVDQPPPPYRPADNPPPPPEGGSWPPPAGGQAPPPPQGQGYGQPGGSGWGEPGGYPPQQQGGPGRYPPPSGGSGLAENVASGLSYVLTWLTGLLFFLIDKRPEVRFHAMQSIVYGVLWTLIAVVRPYMPGPVGALFGLVLFVFFIGWIVLLIQGFQGKHFKLPVIGDFAEQQAGRPTL